MTWILAIVILLLLLLSWMLVSPLILELDTRSGARFTWTGIGRASVWYDGEWWMFFRVLFYSKTIKLSGHPAKKQSPPHAVVKKQERGRKVPFLKIIRCIKTFRVEEWRLSLDTGDYPLNAQLYPLNFMRGLRGHLHINYMEENSLYLKIRNHPWKILYAFIR